MTRFTYIKISRRNDSSELKAFVNATDGYVMSFSAEGYVFGYIKGSEITELTLDRGCALSGAQIVDALRSLCSLDLVDTDNTDRVLASIGIPEVPLRLSMWNRSSFASDAPDAYRTFLSTRDLEQIFSFPFQKAYAGSGRLIVVGATVSLMPDSDMRRITEPIVKTYQIVYPAGVTPSATAVDEGDSLSLTFSQDGCVPVTHTVTVGQSSPFIVYVGACIKVRSASQMGMAFEPVPAAEPAVMAAPSEKMVTLRINFNDERVVEQLVPMDRDSAEYRLLRAGNFYGFRARRMPVHVRGEETYTIEVMPAHEQAPVAESEKEPQPPMPAPPRRRRKERRGAGVIIVTVLLAISVGLLAIWALPDLFDRATNYEPGVFSESVIGDDTIAVAPVDTVVAPVVAQVPDTVVAAGSTPDEVPPVVDEATLEAADLQYLNASYRWRLDDLKSQKYREFFTLIGKGNLREILDYDYFKVKGRSTNAVANRIIDLIWRAKGSSTQLSNERVLKRYAEIDDIDLEELYDALTRVQSEAPNRKPRPQIDE